MSPATPSSLAIPERRISKIPSTRDSQRASQPAFSYYMLSSTFTTQNPYSVNVLVHSQSNKIRAFPIWLRGYDAFPKFRQRRIAKEPPLGSNPFIRFRLREIPSWRRLRPNSLATQHPARYLTSGSKTKTYCLFRLRFRHQSRHHAVRQSPY